MMTSTSLLKAMRTAFEIITLFAVGAVVTTPHYPKTHENAINKREVLEWTVIGDSWASGVAYNFTNVYAPTDREFVSEPRKPGVSKCLMTNLG